MAKTLAVIIMTIVIGQIESLNRLKATLSEKGIDRFHSIRDINNFTKNYELEKQQIINQVEQDLKTETDALLVDKVKLQKEYDNLRTENKNILNNKIIRLKGKYDLANSKNANNHIKKTFNWLKLKILKFKIAYLQKNFDNIIKRRNNTAEKRLSQINIKISEYTVNRNKIISSRSSSKLNNLGYIKKIIDELYPLITGAIGENLVEKEIRKLSDNYILFNDFSINFKTPIYNKKENDRISSIQIDHLLISNAGIFIIETKNWSKKSVENFDLRSPVKQIMRTSYALFVLLNSDSKQRDINFNKHHWGEKQLPIRNIVAMVNEKPKEKFKYVQIKTLNELNRYLTWFDPIFNDSEVSRISEYLKKIKN